MKRNYGKILVLIALLLCFSSVSSGESLTKNDTLIVGQYEPATNFNPVYYLTAYDEYVVDLIFQGLIKRNFEGEYEGIIAESWVYSNDGKTITFKMKKKAKFSDGIPVTAHDIVFTYKVLADPSYSGRNSLVVEDMKGYKEYKEGKTKGFEGVVALDDYTVQFNFNEAMRVNIDSCSYPIMARHYYGVNYSYGNTAPVKAITTEPMGSGPYKLKEYKEEEYIHLIRNDNYVGEGYLIKNIKIKFYHNDITLFESGEIDLLPGILHPYDIEYARSEGLKINNYPRSGYGYIGVNNEWGPTSDLKVRQALYYAFDREVLIDWYFTDEYTGEAFAEIQSYPLSQMSWALDKEFLTKINNYKFNLEKAKLLLDEAGWKVNTQGFREKDGKVMELKIAAMPDNFIQEIFTYLWEIDWEQELGIKLNIEYVEFSDLIDFVFTKSDENVEKWNLLFLSTLENSPDPNSLYIYFHSDYIGSGNHNISRYSNPKVDELLDRGKAIMDKEEAKLLYQEIIKILNEEVAIMPVYSNMVFDVYNSKLTNFNTSSFYRWVDALKDAKIAK